jgi:hypothetical protein
LVKISNNPSEEKLLRKKGAKLLLYLRKAGFTVIFLDEFHTNDDTHHKYNWAPIG